MSFERIAVIGAGAWGSALASVIARAGRAVTLAARDDAGAQALLARRESPRLPGHAIDQRVRIVAASGEIARHDALPLAVPAQQLRAAAALIAPALAKGTP